MSPFFRLPIEIVSQFSFYVLADTPLGPPKALLDLALTCRFLKDIVTSNQFLAKLCRFKFDVGSIKRRCFDPRDRDLADELVRLCRIMQDIRRADLSEIDFLVDDTLWAAYLLLLSNDGKNYAQLEYAGLDAYMDHFVRHRLWDGRETNQGWPLDNVRNSLALWVVWMTLTKKKLETESLADREEMILLTLPYVVLPHRYPSALAPPNHFNLPLDARNPYHQEPLITTLSPSTPYPIYIPDHSADVPYFNARIAMCPPLVTIAAKLLFVARKEMSPLRAPPHLPQGPGAGIVGVTQQDFLEVNTSPGARLCRVVTWDWDSGCPRQVGEAVDDETVEDWEESKVWDTEWWRRLLCCNCRQPRPKYSPGDVFNLGSMSGNWHGKEYLPQGNLFIQFLQHPNILYPGIPDAYRPHLFTEGSLGLSMKPVFLDIQEHHKICECPQESHSNSHPYTTATLSFSPSTTTSTASSLPVLLQSGRCGVVPIPAPLVFVSAHQPADVQAAGHAHADADVDENADENIQVDQPSDDALSISLPPSEIRNVIDYSMSNAWFPGNLGGVSFAKLSSPTTGFGLGKLKRDKVLCAVDFQAPNTRGRPEEAECLTLGGRGRVEGHRDVYVYETYDPEKVSVHRGLGMGDSTSGSVNAFTPSGSAADAATSDPHKCSRCLEREALIRIERKKAEERSKRMLDRGIRSFGQAWTGWGEDDDEYMYSKVEVEEDMVEEGKEPQDLDVSALIIDLGGIEEPTASSSSSGSRSTTPTPIMTFGDDHDGAYFRLNEPSRSLEPTRRVYDKCRIGVECTGVADILLSGETGPRHAIWQQYTMYGRIRPWDGLIGILKKHHAPADNGTLSNIFIFGYLVGENNFVGEWRLAASDPLRPTWGSAFVMSRRVGGSGGGQRTNQA